MAGQSMYKGKENYVYTLQDENMINRISEIL